MGWLMGWIAPIYSHHLDGCLDGTDGDTVGAFCSATTQMSSTKMPTLSHVHTIFRGLQDELKDILCALPNSVSPNIKKGLTDAHRKLSDYYYKFDESPFYIWAACTHYPKLILTCSLTFFGSPRSTDLIWRFEG